MRVTPELLLQAYSIGVFPMAEGRDDPNLFFVDPDRRGVIPLDRFHISRSLRKLLRKRPFRVSCNRAFEAVVRACAAPTPGRPDTWINQEILDLYLGLYDLGFGFSIETWQEDELVGGLYGVALGGAFFGESMFSRADNASKVALCHLVARLKAGGFLLLDSQFITPHLARFGAEEVGRADYHRLLRAALESSAVFYCEGDDWPLVDALMQSSTQTS